LKNCWLGWAGIEPITLDLCSQSGAYDRSATATPWIEVFYEQIFSFNSYSL